ncbi:hypothetical protein RYX36_010886, partial [Vicia faba]
LQLIVYFTFLLSFQQIHHLFYIIYILLTHTLPSRSNTFFCNSTSSCSLHYYPAKGSSIYLICCSS